MNVFIEVVKNIAVVIGCISGILTLIFMISKKLRDWFKIKISKSLKVKEDYNQFKNMSDKLEKYMEEDKEFKKSIKDDMEVQKDFSRDQSRMIIKDVFFKYCNEKRIPLYELKIVKSVYDIYKNKLNGNSYISLLYEEIIKWEIDYTIDFSHNINEN